VKVIPARSVVVGTLPPAPMFSAPAAMAATKSPADGKYFIETSSPFSLKKFMLRATINNAPLFGSRDVPIAS